MDDEQRKTVEELIRVARVASYTVRGLWSYAKRGSSFEAALFDIETRLDAAAESAFIAIADKPANQERVH